MINLKIICQSGLRSVYSREPVPGAALTRHTRVMCERRRCERIVASVVVVVCRGRLAAVLKQAQQGSVPPSKVDQAREEVEDAMARMEQTRVR